MFEKKWFRFICNLILAVVLFFAILFGIIVNQQVSNSLSTLRLGFGALAYIGVFFFYLAFDLMDEVQIGLLRIIRGILLLVGTVFVLGIGFLSSLAFLMEKPVIGNPWLVALELPWLLAAILTFLLYCIGLEKDWTRIIFPFLPFIALAGCYLLSVPLVYLGQSVSSFFKEWFPLILCVVAFIAVIIYLKREGFPFRSSARRSAYTPTSSSDYTDSKNQGGSNATDKRRTGGIAALKRKLGEPFQTFISFADYDWYWSEGPTFTVEERYGDIFIHWKGTLSFPVGTYDSECNPKYVKTEIEEKINTNVKDVQERIAKKTKKIYLSLQKEYKDLDKACSVEISITPEIRSH